MWIYLFMALAAGAVLPLQAGLNAQLALSAGHALWAACASFAIGLLLLLAVCLTVRLPRPVWGDLAAMPFWQWSGGLMGAFFVTAMVMLSPRLGAATMLGMVLVGQMTAAALIDHFGLAGFTPHALSIGRAVGIALLIAGGIIVRLY
ncbi:transporter family-2 protein [Halopseudomonas litoralis]|uniref:Transporter family-2 protein n=1 Tax=Halopseudomonas litoralis TaxID=797277 RepID=A0A1H1XZK1_9GAMM|nr:DMT family transporter [Halopseudomonas litoralis]SDT14623.1 transporter family-2 protein [Halopseudomonas litoralis]